MILTKKEIYQWYPCLLELGFFIENGFDNISWGWPGGIEKLRRGHGGALRVKGIFWKRAFIFFNEKRSWGLKWFRACLWKAHDGSMTHLQIWRGLLLAQTRKALTLSTSRIFFVIYTPGKAKSPCCSIRLWQQRKWVGAIHLLVTDVWS